jgi:hypothetical protein
VGGYGRREKAPPTPGRRRRIGPRLSALAPALLAVAIPVVIVAGAGVNAAVRHLFAPRPAYGTPPPASQALLVWDGARRQVVMVAGPGGHPKADPSTWAWDGSGWIQHPADIQPPVGDRFVGTAAYDPIRRSVVDVVTDVGNPEAPADIWEWSGAAWQQMLTDGKPLVVGEPAIGYDDTHSQLIVVGQDPHGPGSLTTWILRGTEWSAVPNLVEAPGPAHLAFDATSHRLLLFPSAYVEPAARPCPQPAVVPGGPVIVGDCFPLRARECLGCPVDPLAWDGHSWTATGMTARDGTVVADPTSDGLLDVVDAGGKARGVWRWDGRSWARIAGLPFPPSLVGWRAAPDPDAHQLVLFGGTESNGGWNPVEKTSDQTWTFDGQTWSLRSGRALPKLPPPATPPPPPPCTSKPAGLQTGRGDSGDVFLSMQIPIAGPPGSCVSVPARVRLETSTGTLLAVQGNPAGLASLPAYGDGTAFAGASWTNWCGQRAGIVARLEGQGFRLTERIAAPPPCRSGRLASTLTVIRPMPMP